MSWKIFQRWFNGPPTIDAELITDDRGKKFWAFWETQFELGPTLYVDYRGKWIGVVESCWEENRKLALDDIIIFERYNSFRQHGLGKKMMQCFIRRAKEAGAGCIWGFIQPHEGSTQEFLVRWYQMLGFQAYEAKPGIFHILLELQDQPT